jgi:hypothetical protein
LGISRPKLPKKRRANTNFLKKVGHGTEEATVGKLSADSMAALGRELRLMYADIIVEGVPVRFAEILWRLDEPGNEGSKASRHRLIKRTRTPCDEPLSSTFTEDRDTKGLSCRMNAQRSIRRI